MTSRCLNNTGREAEEGNENFAPGSAEGQRLAKQLRRESAGVELQ
ncbi:hypothetical protein [Streptomyces niveus]|nr:hypothetical protein [Streptomyces niveus]